MDHGIEDRKRWFALTVLCLGVLMIVLDTTIVTVALPSIRTDLGFTETSLVWVVNAYMLTFGGFMLLGGRLGDLYGHRRLFLLGLACFTLASLACGSAETREALICARAAQGLGGAVVSAVALSLVMNLFTEPDERAKAMGIYGFVYMGGGSIGVLLGGLLTKTLSWHWIFLVNLPVGVVVYVLCSTLLPRGGGQAKEGPLDIGGAITITLALLLAVYAVVNGNEVGWHSAQSVAMLTAAVLFFVLFLIIESRVRAPLVPLRLFRLRSLATANVIRVLWSAAIFTWFFMSSLYMERVLGYDPMQIALSFLPANLTMAAFSLGLSAKLVIRFGIRAPLVVGMLFAAAGLAVFADAPIGSSFATSLLPSMLLLGLGGGMAFSPMMLAAMSDVAPSEAGLASGIVSTSFMMGGSLGLAILASLAAARTRAIVAAGTTLTVALHQGYQRAFLWSAVLAIGAALLGIALLRPPTQAQKKAPG